jgi:membrane dipeptidase
MPETLRKLGFAVPAVVLLVLAGCSPAVSDEPLARAQRLLESTPLVDGHNDLPWALRELGIQEPDGLDLNKRQLDLMTDMVRLQEGGVGGQFWVCYVPTSSSADGLAAHQALEQIDLIHRLVEAYPHRLQPALTAADIVAVHASGRVASLIGLEGYGCSSLITCSNYFKLTGF